MWIVNVPIESMMDRYSAQWNRWFPKEFQRLNIKFTNLDPNLFGRSDLKDGWFADILGTNFYKAGQIKQFCQWVRTLGAESFNSQCVVFVHDLWYPGLEVFQYIRDAMGLKFKIFGMLHAGTYDPADILTQKGMEWWAKNLEQTWFSFIDGIFVATEYHKNLLLSKRNVAAEKVFVTGFPIYPEFVQPSVEKQNIVVFPHRLFPNKNPQLFDALIEKAVRKDLTKTWQFIKTKEVKISKYAYYELLNKSKIAVSFAAQETWGIAQMEATLCGNIPVVPDRVSYSELYQSPFKQHSDEDVINYTLELVENEKEFAAAKSLLPALQKKFIDQGACAIEKMVRIMKEEVEK